LDSCSEHLVQEGKKTPTYPSSKSNPLVPILGRWWQSNDQFSKKWQPCSHGHQFSRREFRWNKNLVAIKNASVVEAFAINTEGKAPNYCNTLLIWEKFL
jgi:hypothetical protein